MAPATTNSSPSAQRHVGFSRRTQAPRQLDGDSPPVNKYRMLSEIMARAPYAVVERETYSDLLCDQCGSGELPEELLLCDKCDKGFHMKCVRPIVVRIPIGSWLCPNCQGGKRVRPFSQKKIIDFFGIRRSSDDANDKRSSQALNMEFSDHLTYLPGMAPRCANQALLENGGMQTLSKEDMETLEQCIALSKRGEFPPFMVVYDSREGYTVEADDLIKDMTIIAEYTGDVDYLDTRERDDCDSMMTLLLGAESSQSLVICADKRGNIARFISGINNHTQEGRKKQNCKCVRYNVNGECRVFLVAIRDISKGERLYYDYNGHEYQYPTHHFV
ncbi:putative Histone-lysine N-methyltransferase ATXR5 isoform B [Glycine soja]|uniref:Putative Histone-lysine N-methyltransferase ATXR5 isoform B n=1 Tax=Glycine soja TaxID=3848 RepID=A0A445KA09_GLYSO|nr:putative Histone-lysine N-methyltransferase ATXR5 isoform B [Glycine soja]